MTFDLSTYTIDSANDVNVATFREAIAHLEQVVRRDYGACVFDSERAACIDIAKRVGSELIGMTCKRATVADWDRRERAIERSTKLATQHAMNLRVAAVAHPRDLAWTRRQDA